jgi:hypothetical protein
MSKIIFFKKKGYLTDNYPANFSSRSGLSPKFIGGLQSSAFFEFWLG